LKSDDERGFIIEPLLELSPLKPAVKLEEVLGSLKGISIPKVKNEEIDDITSKQGQITKKLASVAR
jgi:hypothetical protein